MQMSNKLEEVLPGALSWLASVHAGGARYKYNLHMQRAWGVESSAMAASLKVRVIGAKPAAPALAAWIAEIQGWQDAKTGLFLDPLISESDRVQNATHSWEHIWNHHTGVCAEALHDLGAAPLHPLPETGFGLGQVDQTPVDVARWVQGLGWENPWLVGEHFYRGISLLVRRHGVASDLVASAFRTLEHDVLTETTGYPDRRNRMGVPSAMAGLFKVIFAYHLANRPLPRAQVAVDTTLALQTPDGGMGMDNLCIHWDAAWVLKNLNAQLAGGYRSDDLRACGRRLADFLLRTHRKPDGGFSFYATHCVPAHNSIVVSKALPESDIMGTLMSCECLAYSREWDQGVATPTVP
jgi:hypothetical protein